MRYLAKNPREHSGATSSIFQQAKQRFHYSPSQNYHKPFLISKYKNPSHPARDLKHEFSSVKDTKFESNSINESSWIAKLVNVMHENSIDRPRTINEKPLQVNIQITQPQHSTSIQENVTLDFKDYKQKRQKELSLIKKIDVQEKSLLASCQKNMKLPVYNKQNRKKQQKFQHREGISPGTTRKNTIKKSKSSLKFKQSISKSKQKKILKNKSSQKEKISGSQKAEQKSEQRHEQNQSWSKKKGVQSTKWIESKRSKYQEFQSSFKEFAKSRQKQDITSTNKCLLRDQSIFFEESEDLREINKKIDVILDHGIKSPLFRPKEQQSLMAEDQGPKSSEQNRIKDSIKQAESKQKLVGSIKKNQARRNSQLPQQKIIILHETFGASDNFCLKQDDIVTEREQKKLISKYCKNKTSYNTYDYENYRFLNHSINSHSVLAPKENTRKYNYVDSSNKQNFRPCGYENLVKQGIKSETESNIAKIKNKYQYIGLNQQQQNKSQTKSQKKPYRDAYLKENSNLNLSYGKNDNCLKIDSIYTAQHDRHLGIKDFAQKSIRSGIRDIQQNIIIPSKHSYLEEESILEKKNICGNVSIQGNQKKEQVQSERMIDRLNSKLSEYIRQHQLGLESEGTHRKMQLNFDELKKHGSLNII